MESNYLIYLAESAALTVILGFFAIPLLKKLKARQSIREEGPKSHRVKNGTPTMGGLFMLLTLPCSGSFSLPWDMGFWAFLMISSRRRKKEIWDLRQSRKCWDRSFWPFFSAGA